MQKSTRLTLVLSAVVAALVLIALGAGAASAASEEQLVTYWGSPGSGDGQFSNPADVAVAPDGDVYVADRGNYRIEHLSAAGAYLGKWGSFGTEPGQFSDDLVAVAVAPSGKVFTLDQVSKGGTRLRVQRFSATGAYEVGWGAATGSALGQFDEPSDIAVGPSGTVYVVEAGNRRVQSFDADGGSAASWGTVGGGGEGQFSKPVGIAVNQSTGNVYVADAGATPRVQEFSSSGSFITQWGSAGGTPGQFSFESLAAIAVGPEGDVFTREATHEGERYQRFGSSGEFVGESYWYTAEDPHGLAVTGDDALLAPDPQGGQLERRDISTPFVSLLGPLTAVPVGKLTFFQATATVELGHIVRYEWDLNGDGVYELNTGASNESTTTFGHTGVYMVGVRVTSQTGASVTDHREVEVEQTQPSGPVGVSIDGGAQFTNDPEVDVGVVWPWNATLLTISNDGGFVPSSILSVAPTVHWTLDSSGPERLPKTIYVRFSGGASGNETYQDDIILDQIPPTIGPATIAPVLGGGFDLSLRAKDNVSGVARMQVAGNRHHPGAWRNFKPLTRLSGNRKSLWVRLSDRAGNVSRWKHAARQH